MQRGARLAFFAFVTCALLLAAPAAAYSWNGHGNNGQGHNGQGQNDNNQGEHGHGHFNALVVSTHGDDSSDCGRPNNPCRTISQAVFNANNGATIFVLPGTYNEMVTVNKPVHLRGVHATIDATGENNGVLLQGSAASNSSVSGFTVENAIGEGILASQVDHVFIAWNNVMQNDRGDFGAPNSYFECQTMGEVPGDCGEGLHVQASTNSTVLFNNVSNNAGGILVSDDLAATHGNVIAFNRVTDNAPDCGITVPTHLAGAGVFDNTITFNDVERNGEGGVLIGQGADGGAVFNNRITHNFLQDNGFAGVTIHAHTPNGNLNNNVIDANTINTNNVTGDDDAGVMQTTGILILSQAGLAITGTEIQGNRISNNHFGVWLTPGVVDASGIANNFFSNVDIDVQQ